MVTYAMDNTLSDDDLNRVYRTSIKLLGKWGWNMRDIDNRSAVNWAMLKAIPRWCPERGSFLRMVLRYAMRELRITELRMRTLHKGDRAGVDRGLVSSPPPTPIPLTDFELLSFVAAHGRMKSATMLGMTPAALRDLLDVVALRVREGVDVSL